MRHKEKESSTTLCVLKAIAASLVAGAIVVHVVVRLGGLPIVEIEPHGTCVRVLAYEDEREVLKDCGWEKGRRYNTRYVAPDPSRPRGGKG